MEKNIIDELNFYDNSYNVNEIIHTNVLIYTNYEYKNKKEQSGFIGINLNKYNKKNIFLPLPQRIEARGNIINSGKIGYNKLNLLKKILEYAHQMYNINNIDNISDYIFKFEEHLPLIDSQYEDFKNPEMKEIFIKFFREFGISNNYKDKRRLHFSL